MNLFRGSAQGSGLRCRVKNPQVDPLFGSARGAGKGIHQRSLLVLSWYWYSPIFPDHWADPKGTSILGALSLHHGLVDSRIGESMFWIFQRLWVEEPRTEGF